MTADAGGTPGRVTVLTSGATVFVYPAEKVEAINTMEAVLDVAHPAGEVGRFTLTPEAWERAKYLLADLDEPVEIIDVRPERA